MVLEAQRCLHGIEGSFQLTQTKERLVVASWRLNCANMFDGHHQHRTEQRGPEQASLGINSNS